MSNEATIRSSLAIRKLGTGNSVLLNYSALPTDFRATVTGTKGPTPGAINVTVAGTDVDLSQLTTPGLCRIMNQSDTYFVTVGIWDGTSTFFPILELKPGETFVLRLSRLLGKEYGTGTGTTGSSNNKLRIRADTAACVVLVEAFEA